MSLNKTPALPELRVELEYNEHLMQAEALGFRKNLEGLYAGHYKIVWTTHKPHLIFLHQHINISEMLQKFNYKINKRGNSRALLVSWTAEPILPLPMADHSLSFYPDTTTNTWYPETVYLVYDEFVAMLNGKPTQQMLANKRTPKSNFCAFINSNSRTGMYPHVQARLDLCTELMEYKKVLCPGKSMNNVQPPDYLISDTYLRGDFIKGLVRYLAECKFYIAFENSVSSKLKPNSINYITVKIMTAFIAGSIPIYYGYREVAELFNPAAFINANNFSSQQELVEYIKEVDNSPELTAAYQNAPPILPDSPLHNFRVDKMRPLFLSFAERALKQSSKPFILQPNLILRKMGTVPKSNPIGFVRVSYRYTAQKIKNLKK